MVVLLALITSLSAPCTKAAAQGALQAARKDFTKRGVVALDLPSDGQNARRAADKALAKKEWCDALDEIQAMRASVTRSDGVSAKVAKLRGMALKLKGKPRQTVEKQLLAAEREIEASHMPLANKHANAALFTISHSKDPLWLPRNVEAPSDPSVTKSVAFTAADLPADEVHAGCAEVDGKTGKGLPLASVLDRLKASLDGRAVRVVDLKRGQELHAELARAMQARNTTDAVKIACAMKHRATEVTDDLDRAMARFQRVNALRDQHPIDGSAKAAFDQLVTQASAQIAARAFMDARLTLERLLILLGEPTDPSSEIPKM